MKSVVQVCPGYRNENFKLNDLFNLLDLHIPFKFGFRAPAEGQEDFSSGFDKGSFFDARRLIGAKNALLLILLAFFHMDYRTCLERRRDVLEKYRDFALRVGERMQSMGGRLADEGVKLDTPEFYKGDTDFVSLNYDPIALWIQFIAHRDLNSAGAVPHFGNPAIPLHLFHDFGHLIPARGVERTEARWPWYPLNEGAAQRLNEEKYPSGYRVRLTKFLFLHGCLCWRECPNCGKLSAYHGDEWDLFSRSLVPPPPLRAFDPDPCP